MLLKCFAVHKLSRMLLTIEYVPSEFTNSTLATKIIDQSKLYHVNCSPLSRDFSKRAEQITAQCYIQTNNFIENTYIHTHIYTHTNKHTILQLHMSTQNASHRGTII